MHSLCQKALLICLLAFAVTQTPVKACEGTPRPACERSVWLTVLTPGNVAIPQSGQINIPMVFLPYVFWNPALGCAQPTLTGEDPTRSALTLNIMVQIQVISVSSGNMTDLGTQMFDAPAPTSPGQAAIKEDIVIPDGQLE